MQNKVYKLREDQGWKQVRKQLDIDLPVAKKKDKKIVWLILLAGLSLSGIWYNSYQSNPLPESIEHKPSEVPSSQDRADLIPPTTHQSAVINPEESIGQSTLAQPQPLLEKENSSNSIPAENQTIVQANVSGAKSNSRPKNRKSDIQVASNPTDRSTLPPNRAQFNPAQTEEFVSNETPKVALPANETAINQSIDHPRISEEPKVTDAQQPAIEITTTQSAAGHIVPDSELTHSSDKPLDEALTEILPSQPLESPIQVVMSPAKRRGNSLYSTIENSSDKFFSGYFMAGKNWPVGNKFYVASQAGLGFQFNKSNYTVIGSNGLSSSNSGKGNHDINNSPVFSSVQADKILLDQGRLISGFRGDTLVLSANDEIYFHSRNQWMAAIQAGFGYQVSSKWSLESGLHFKSYLTSTQELLQVNYSPSLNNGFNTNSSSIYKLNASTPRSQWSWYINASALLTQRWGLNLQFNTAPFIIRSRKSELAQSVSGVGQSNSPAKVLSLPVKQNASSLRLSIQYKF